MLNIKKLSIVAALALSSLSANAATYSLVTSSNANGSFTLTSSFTVSSGYTADLSGAIASVFKSLNTVSNVKAGIDLSSVTLSSGTLSASETEATSIIAVVAGKTGLTTTDTISFSADDLVAGAYTLTFTGWAYSSGASVTLNSTVGSYDVILTAVPEPESFALMGLGLGVLGFMTRRRQA